MSAELGGLKGAIKALLRATVAHDGAVTDESEGLTPFLERLETVLRHGLIVKYNMISRLPSDYFNFVEDAASRYPSACYVGAVREVQGLAAVQTNAGRGLAFLRLALSEMRLNEYMEALMSAAGHRKSWYKDEALVNDQENQTIFLSLLMGLSGIRFDLPHNNADLDKVAAARSTLPALPGAKVIKKKKVKAKRTIATIEAAEDDIQVDAIPVASSVLSSRDPSPVPGEGVAADEDARVTEEREAGERETREREAREREEREREAREKAEAAATAVAPPAVPTLALSRHSTDGESPIVSPRIVEPELSPRGVEMTMARTRAREGEEENQKQEDQEQASKREEEPHDFGGDREKQDKAEPEPDPEPSEPQEQEPQEQEPQEPAPQEQEAQEPERQEPAPQEPEPQEQEAQEQETQEPERQEQERQEQEPQTPQEPTPQEPTPQEPQKLDPPTPQEPTPAATPEPAPVPKEPLPAPPTITLQGDMEIGTVAPLTGLVSWDALIVDGYFADGGLAPRQRSNSQMWGPPELKLILQVKDKTPSKAGKICQGCKKQPHGYFQSLRLCTYTGKYYCSECHVLDKSIIPAKIVHGWDFRAYKVSTASRDFIQSIMDEPLVDKASLKPELLTSVKALAEACELRTQLFYVRDYVNTCRDREKLIQHLGNRLYVIYSPDFFSLADLVCVSNGTYTPWLSQMTKRFFEHITKTCPICQGKGHTCEICNRGAPLYPFQTKETAACPVCSALFHAACFQPGVTVCPKCERRRVLEAKGSHRS